MEHGFCLCRTYTTLHLYTGIGIINAPHIQLPQRIHYNYTLYIAYASIAHNPQTIILNAPHKSSTLVFKLFTAQAKHVLCCAPYAELVIVIAWCGFCCAIAKMHLATLVCFYLHILMYILLKLLRIMFKICTYRKMVQI